VRYDGNCNGATCVLFTPKIGIFQQTGSEHRPDCNNKNKCYRMYASCSCNRDLHQLKQLLGMATHIATFHLMCYRPASKSIDIQTPEELQHGTLEYSCSISGNCSYFSTMHGAIDFNLILSSCLMHRGWSGNIHTVQNVGPTIMSAVTFLN